LIVNSCSISEPCSVTSLPRWTVSGIDRFGRKETYSSSGLSLGLHQLLWCPAVFALLQRRPVIASRCEYLMGPPFRIGESSRMKETLRKSPWRSAASECLCSRAYLRRVRGLELMSRIKVYSRLRRVSACSNDDANVPDRVSSRAAGSCDSHCAIPCHARYMWSRTRLRSDVSFARASSTVSAVFQVVMTPLTCAETLMPTYRTVAAKAAIDKGSIIISIARRL
jgi:hypothetical protein